jgi:hypothetical protein
VAKKQEIAEQINQVLDEQDKELENQENGVQEEVVVPEPTPEEAVQQAMSAEYWQAVAEKKEIHQVSTPEISVQRTEDPETGNATVEIVVTSEDTFNNLQEKFSENVVTTNAGASEEESKEEIIVTVQEVEERITRRDSLKKEKAASNVEVLEAIAKEVGDDEDDLETVSKMLAWAKSSKKGKPTETFVIR